MPGHDQNLALGAAVAEAMRDAARVWAEENNESDPIGDALAMNAAKIEVHGTLMIGGPFSLAIEVKDRRPGRSSLSSYVLERTPHQKALFRNKR